MSAQWAKWVRVLLLQAMVVLAPAPCWYKMVMLYPVPCWYNSPPRGGPRASFECRCTQLCGRGAPVRMQVATATCACTCACAYIARTCAACGCMVHTIDKMHACVNAHRCACMPPRPCGRGYTHVHRAAYACVHTSLCSPRATGSTALWQMHTSLSSYRV